MKIAAKKLHILSVTHLLILSVWWLSLQLANAPSDNAREWFGAFYGTMALTGAIIGFIVARLWGGWKSLIGRAIIVFSIGLLAQEFGQISYSLYTLLFHKEVPYPSIGDIGFVGSVAVYMYGVILLGKALAVDFTSKNFSKNLLAVLVPVVILGISFAAFLKDYGFSDKTPITMFIDFGVPIGQSLYISFAILIYMFSRKFLGGVMRPVILALLVALGFQYMSEFTFLYQSNKETWSTAGINDYMYLFSYFVMATVLIRFKAVGDNLNKPEKTPETAVEGAE